MERVETTDLRLTVWLYLNKAELVKIIPVETSKCPFTFSLSSKELDRLMDIWVNGQPTFDVRTTVDAYQHLVHRGKERLGRRGGGR